MSDYHKIVIEDPTTLQHINLQIRG